MGFATSELESPEALESDLECPVCTGVLIDAVATPCGHSFCRLCAERALERRPHCPMCRAAVRPEELGPVNLINLRVAALHVKCGEHCSWRGRSDMRRAHRKACPAVRASEFTATLRGKVGLELERFDGQNLVVAVVSEGGAAERHNEAMAHCPPRQIKPCCLITEVDDVRGDANELLYAIQKKSGPERALSVVFRRPTEFCATFDKNLKPLGLNFAVPASRQGYLIVQNVNSEGAIGEYNAYAPEEVKRNDRIVEVNGFHGDCRQMVKRIHEAATCSLTIRRLSP